MKSNDAYDAGETAASGSGNHSRQKFADEYVRSQKAVVKAEAVSALEVEPDSKDPDAKDSDAKYPDGRKSIVSGNGFGYAVLNPDGIVSKLYAHPYRFTQANADATKEGIPTFNFVERLSWQQKENNDAQKRTVSYLSESNIMQVRDSSSRQLYFMPYGLHRNALVTTISGADDGSAREAELKPVWSDPVKKEEQIVVDSRAVKVITFENKSQSIAMIPLDLATKTEGHGWAIVPLEKSGDVKDAVADVKAWQMNLSPDALAEKELRAQEDWRVKPDITFTSEAEKRVWRQSESILRMAQISEPNTDTRKNNGLINASLPEGEWFIPWVRDMSYAVNGLTKMGHTDEARKGLMAYFNAPSTGMQSETRGHDYQISVVRYYGDGKEEADYSGEKTPNVELDNWGLVLWTSGEYFKKTHDVSFLNEPTAHGSVYQSMRDRIVSPLLANTDKQGDGIIVAADSSPWEEHQQNKKHFAFSTIMAIRGLRGFLPMAEAMHDDAAVKNVNEKIDVLEKGFRNAFIENGALKGTLEPSLSHDADGSVVEAFNYDVVQDPKVLENTLKKMELLREPSGGFRRVRGDTEYEKHEFLMINFYLARLYFKLGRDQEGMKILDTMVQRADQDNGRIPEMYVSSVNEEFPGPVNTPTGALPMVGYGAGAFVTTLEEREAERLSKLKSKN